MCPRTMTSRAICLKVCFAPFARQGVANCGSLLAFLSRDMTYSSAIFVDLDSDLSDAIKTDGMEMTEDDEELHLSQLRKLDYLIEKLKLPSDRPARVLEIGTGWGSMAIRIAERYPLATVDTLTLSAQQQALARERISAKGPALAKRIQVHDMDYRTMPREWEGAFDGFVSVEMMEHVGKEFYAVYWKMVDWAMKKEDAVGVVQVISMPEARRFSGFPTPARYAVLTELDRLGFDKYDQAVGFVRKWVSRFE